MHEVISDNLDLWSSTLLTKSTAGRGSKGKDEAYGIKKLRELVLELAVRGKLVPQDPNDEPASELLRKVASEKARVVKEGKIKKKKEFPGIADHEIPFDVPGGWGWARINDIGHDWGQKIPDVDFTYIDVSAIDNSSGAITSPSVLSASDAPSRARKRVKRGTVIYSTVRPYLKNVCVIEEDYLPEPIASTAFAISHPFQGMPGKFFASYFRSPEFVKYVESVQTGIAYPAINDEQFYGGLVPVPPLAEQHRIVAKVDELMALCDQLEQQQTKSIEAHQTLVETLLRTLTHVASQQEFIETWRRIANHFDTLFTTEHSIDQLKRTVLQLAIMGKLVPQNPSGEPASLMLERIAAEKERLAKEGRIRRQNLLPEIGSDEFSLKLPDGWALSRLGTFTVVGTGATPAREKASYYFPPKINWVTSGETSSDVITDTTEKISPLAVKETNVSVYPIGTLIVAMYGQGKTRGQVSELAIEAGTNQACAAIVLVEQDVYHRKYLKYFFRKAYEEIRRQSAGGAQPNLNVGKISNTVIPLPPLAEQRRIVENLDVLMALCDALKAHLGDAQAIQVSLADAIVEQSAA